MAQNIKVFGIGLNKTGTTSLRVALKVLGYNHLNRKPRLMRLWRRGDIAALLEASEEFDSFDDWPWPLIVPQLLTHYGEGARFVLTHRRTPGVWLDSMKAHSERTNPFRNPRRLVYGYDYPHGREATYLKIYNQHLTQTRALFEAKGMGHLLLDASWDSGDGWRELCDFVGRKIPQRAFPHANRGADATPDPEQVDDNRFLIARQMAMIERDTQTAKIA